jgi:protein gp37
MSSKSKIEWTESTWNPITGCSKISAGCKNCYAERMAKRLQAMGIENYKNGFKIQLHPQVLEYPLKWKKPQMIFVNSMSDLFHEKIPTSFIIEVIEIIRKASWHTFQVLTKRSNRLYEIDNLIEWPDNIWLGVSVENSEYIERIIDLQKTEAKIKFLSCEPLIGPLKKLPLSNIDWVIVGGESGPFARPILNEWVKDIRDQCLCNNIPFFFKQWGGTNKKKNGRLLEGRTWDELPIYNRELIRYAV